MARRLTRTQWQNMIRNTNNIRAVYGKIEDRYLDLIRRFPLRPLSSAAELDGAVAVIDELLDRESLSTPELDYLDVLSDLVENYEDAAVPMKHVDDAAMLRFLLQSKDVKQSLAATESGIAESTISEVLAGKRKLNRAQIGRLARYFHVEPGAFAFGSV